MINISGSAASTVYNESNRSEDQWTACQSLLPTLPTMQLPASDITAGSGDLMCRSKHFNVKSVWSNKNLMNLVHRMGFKSLWKT